MACLKDQLVAYERWLGRCARVIRELGDWLREQGRASEATTAAIAAARADTDSDRLRIAICATAGSGKIDLVNALFFADYGQGLLPGNAAGDCPIELGWEPDAGPSLRLLPIETRDESLDLDALKHQSERWTTFPLRPQEPDQLDAVFGEIQQTKRLSVGRASRLGLLSVGEEPDDGIEVQRWRYARVSFPHPLLRRGLLLHTATCSANGDMELFQTSCSAAQLTLFLLAADRGLAQSDLDLWQSRLEGFRDNRKKQILVLLTRIDQVGAGGDDSESAVERLRTQTARRLGIDPSRVLPVSARQGLQGLIEKQPQQWSASGLAEVERTLCAELLAHKYQTLGGQLRGRLEPILETNRRELGARIDAARAQIDDLTRVVADSEARIAELLRSTREQQESYLQAARRFGQIRVQIVETAIGGRRRLRTEVVDEMVRRAHRQMGESWMSIGIARALRELFSDLRELMLDANADALELREQIAALYQSYDEQLGLRAAAPDVFRLQGYLAEMDQLCEAAAAFCWQPERLLLEQASLMRRAHQQLIARARVLFSQLFDDWAGWVRESVTPLADAVDQLKVETEAQLAELKQASARRARAREQIALGRRMHVDLARQMTTLRNIQNALEHDPSRELRNESRLHLVGRRTDKQASSGG